MEENKILFLGRIARIKNLEVVIKALPLIKDEKIILEILGPREKNYFNELQALVKTLNLSERVIFSDPVYNIKKKIKKIDSCKIFILPSKSEGMPQSLIEALARKKIVIVSNNPGNKDLIENRENGFIFNIGNVRNLAKVINEVLKMKDKEKTIIKKNARDSVKQFSWDNISKKIEALIT